MSFKNIFLLKLKIIIGQSTVIKMRVSAPSTSSRKLGFQVTEDANTAYLNVYTVPRPRSLDEGFGTLHIQDHEVDLPQCLHCARVPF
jgi:hypothetical protein